MICEVVMQDEDVGLRMTVTVAEMKENKTWDYFCRDNQMDPIHNSHRDTDEISLNDEQAKKYGFLGETWK